MIKTQGKKNNGITLIALVITIVVLLILAGVSIAFLTGDNGIITQATEASKQSEIASVREQAQLDIANWVADQLLNGEDTTVASADDVKNILNKALNAGGEQYWDSFSETGIITPNGYEVPFSELYTVNSGGSGIVEEIAKNPKAYYGKEVTNYKASESDTNTYRIFYIDTENYFGDGENTIYLKADYSSTNYNLNNYASYDVANTKVREMNHLWATERGTSESSWNINEKVAAYLCSPVNADNYESTLLPWNGYYNSENANYVIGGPSIEMYVKSYNQAYEGIADTNVYTLGANYRATNYPGYIYTLNGAQSTISNSDYNTGTDSLDYTRYNSMYCGENGTKTGYWCLASPSAYDSNIVCLADGDYACLNSYFYDSVFALAPLVSLKSSFIPEIEE